MFKQAINTALRLSCCSLFFTLLTLAQEPAERVLNTERLPPYAVAALAISNLQVEDQSITFGKRFKASDAWAKSLQFEVKNVSDKVITYFELGLRTTSPDSRHLSWRMFSYGTRAETPTTSPARRLLPGETVQIQYSEQMYRGFQRMQADFNLKSVTELTLAMDFVLFEDDTALRHGLLMQRDPSNPSRWLVIGREQFIR